MWIPGWMTEYRKEWLRPDVIAGTTAAAVVIPKAMAYATIAGLPVQVGLYTVFLPMLIYAVLGTSRPLSVSTTTTLAILTGAEFAEIAVKGDPTRAKRLMNKRVLLETFDFQKIEINGRTEPKMARVLEAEPTEGRKYPRVLFEDQTIGLVVEPKNLKGLYRDMDKVQVIKNEDGTVRIIDNGYIG